MSDNPPPRDAWAVLAELLDRFESLLRMSAEDTAKALKTLKTSRSPTQFGGNAGLRAPATSQPHAKET